MEVKNLIEYMEIVCGKIMSYPLESNHTDNKYLSQMNSIGKEFILRTSSQSGIKTDKKIPEELCEYIDQYYNFIYSYYIKSKRPESSAEKDTHSVKFFFRGVNDVIYPLAPGIYRKDEKHDEYFYFNEIGVRCPEAFRSLTNLEKLAYMQHYGCPTRLLDITANPLVALYFACDGEQAAHQDGVVYIFGIDSEKIRYASSDRIQMLSKFAEFKRCDQEQLRYLSYRNLQSRKFPQDSHRKYQDVVVEQYYHTVKRSNGAFERELNPIDLLAPQFVQPEKNNPRILKQDGAFIVSGLDKNADESNMKIRKYLVNEIHVPALCKALIKDQLANVGISQATLFPEVDKVADYLKRII